MGVFDLGPYHSRVLPNMRQIRVAVVAYGVSQAGQERQEYPIAGLIGFAVQLPLL